MAKLHDQLRRDLDAARLAYVDVHDARKALHAAHELKTFDFVIYRDGHGAHLLAMICRRFTQDLADDMRRWAGVFGDGFAAVLVMPGPDGWRFVDPWTGGEATYAADLFKNKPAAQPVQMTLF